jgi:hypothetical protein
MKKYLLFILLVITVFSNSAFAEENVAKKFIGTWKLISTTGHLK